MGVLTWSVESYCIVSTLPLLFAMYKQTMLRDSGSGELDFSLLFSEAFLRHLFWALVSVGFVFISPLHLVSS